jgi:hypothetical protein
LLSVPLHLVRIWYAPGTDCGYAAYELDSQFKAFELLICAQRLVVHFGPSLQGKDCG